MTLAIIGINLFGWGELPSVRAQVSVGEQALSLKQLVDERDLFGCHSTNKEPPHWEAWEEIRAHARRMPVSLVEWVSLTGGDLGMLFPKERILVRDRRVIAAFKEGLEEAMIDLPNRASPGGAFRNQIVFHLLGQSDKQAEEENGFGFQPGFSILSYGPKFWQALKTFSAWYGATIRTTLAHIEPRTVEAISLYFGSDEGIEITAPKEIASFLATGVSFPSDNLGITEAYDATDRTRSAVRLEIAFKDKKRTAQILFLRVKPKGYAKHERFGLLIRRLME